MAEIGNTAVVPAAPSRMWDSIPNDERIMLRMLYVQGQYSIPQLAREFNLNITSLRGAVYHHEWHRDRASRIPDDKAIANARRAQGAVQLEVVVKHLRFVEQVQETMEKLQAGWSDMADRYLFHDRLHEFPLAQYKEFLEMYGSTMKLIGAVSPISSDVNLHLTQNNTQAHLHVGGNGAALVEGSIPVDDRSARQALDTLLKGVLVKSKPPEPREISVDAEKIDPARGQYR